MNNRFPKIRLIYDRYKKTGPTRKAAYAHRTHIINIKSTLLWTNYRPSNPRFMRFAVSV